jgi:hypothetical protein
MSWIWLILPMRVGLLIVDGPGPTPGLPIGEPGESDSERRDGQGDPFSIGERALNDSSSRSISVPWSIVFAQADPREAS